MEVSTAPKNHPHQVKIRPPFFFLKPMHFDPRTSHLQGHYIKEKNGKASASQSSQRSHPNEMKFKTKKTKKGKKETKKVTHLDLSSAKL
jgi:hypothetical protein